MRLFSMICSVFLLASVLNNCNKSKKNRGIQEKNTEDTEPFVASGSADAIKSILTESPWSLASSASKLAFDDELMPRLRGRYARKNSASGGTEANERCPAELDAEKATKLSIFKDIMQYSLEQTLTDEKACIEGFKGTAKTKTYVWFQCVNADLSSLQGKSVADLDQSGNEEIAIICPLTSTMKLYWEMSYEYKGEVSVKSEGETGSPKESKRPYDISLLFMVSNGSQPCVYKRIDKNNMQLSVCNPKELIVSKGTITTTGKLENTIDYKEEKYSAINQGPHSEYFNGTFDLTLNNWKGKIIFGSLTENPNYGTVES